MYAVANLRGGGEEGEEWHRDGMLANKQNVFDDFHAAAEWLIAEGWTTPDRLVDLRRVERRAAGRRRADPAAGPVRGRWSAAAPLLDMVRYEKFGLGRDLERRVRHRRRPRAAGLAARLLARTTTCARGPRTRRCSSPSSTATPASTRCTRARCARRCSTPPASPRPVLVRREGDVGHGARALSQSIELSADTLAFAAAVSGLERPRGPGWLASRAWQRQENPFSIEGNALIVIAVTVVLAFVLRWVIHRLTDRLARSMANNAITRRMATSPVVSGQRRRRRPGHRALPGADRRRLVAAQEPGHRHPLRARRPDRAQRAGGQHGPAAGQRRARRHRRGLRGAEPRQGLPVGDLHDPRGPVRRRRRDRHRRRGGHGRARRAAGDRAAGRLRRGLVRPQRRRSARSATARRDTGWRWPTCPSRTARTSRRCRRFSAPRPSPSGATPSGPTSSWTRSRSSRWRR